MTLMTKAPRSSTPQSRGLNARDRLKVRTGLIGLPAGRSLALIRRLRCRDFRSAVLGGKHGHNGTANALGIELQPGFPIQVAT